MTTLTLNRAIFGDRNGTHDLLACSGDRDLFRSLPEMEVDLPDQAPAGIAWSPFIRGWQYHDHFLFSRTELDTQANRRGMVRSQLIAVPIKVIPEIENIVVILEALEARWQEELEPVKVRLEVAYRSPQESLIDNRLLAVAELLSESSGGVVVLTEERFSNLVAALWCKLPKDVRPDFRFGFSFTPADLEGRSLHLACTPSALADRWLSYPKRIPSQVELRGPSPAATYLLSLPEAKSIRDGLSELGVTPKTVQDIPLFVRLGSQWCGRKELHRGELRELARDLVEVAPRPEDSEAAKEEVLEALTRMITVGRADDVLALRTVKASAFRQSATKLGKSISAWVLQRFLDGTHKDIMDLAEVVSALPRQAPEEWRCWVRDGLKASFSTPGTSASKTCWNLWIQSESAFDAVAEYIPSEAGFERGWLNTVPSKMTPSLGEKLADWCRSRGWMLLHARVLRAFLDWQTAVRRQLVADTYQESIESIRLSISDIPAQEVALFAIAEGNVRLRQCAAEFCGREANAFESFVATQAGWRDLLLRVLEKNKNFLERIPNNKAILFSLLDVLIAHGPVEELLLAAFADSNLADVTEYAKRKELWARLPERLRGEYLRQTATAWLNSFYAGLSQVSDLEIPIRQSLFVLPAELCFPSTSSPLSSRGWMLLKDCVEATEQAFEAWIDAVVLSRERLGSQQTTEVATLLKNRKWENGALRLHRYGKRENRPDFISIWESYWSSLGRLERLILKLTGLGTDFSPLSGQRNYSEVTRKDKTTALFVTALGIEFKAVAEHLCDFGEETRDGTVYGVGSFEHGGRLYEVAVVQSGMGNQRASLETERAIKNYAPTYAFFVGLAGGLKDDLSIGDVVAADKVYGYEFGKAEESFKIRPEAPYVSYAASQRIQATARSSGWLARIPGRLTHNPKIFVKPIAAGDKVLASLKSPEIKRLKESFNDAYAVEMEGLGFCIAAHANPNVTFALVRGISDLIEGKGEAEKGGSQETAVRNAAAFAFEMLAGFLDAMQNHRGTKKESKRF